MYIFYNIIVIMWVVDWKKLQMQAGYGVTLYDVTPPQALWVTTSAKFVAETNRNIRLIFNFQIHSSQFCLYVCVLDVPTSFLQFYDNPNVLSLILE